MRRLTSFSNIVVIISALGFVISGRSQTVPDQSAGENSVPKPVPAEEVLPLSVSVADGPIELTTNPAIDLIFRPLNQLQPAEIDSLLRSTNTAVSEVNRRIAVYSERAKGTPYSLFCLGEGPNAKYDRGPLVDFSRVDCMTFCEQILALSISSSWDEMFANLQRIRYRNGEIDIRTRNHYTLADWLPNNDWLLLDATEAIGGSFCREMTKTIDRPALLRKLAVPDSELVAVPPPQVMTIKYIPEEYLPAIETNLIGGEVVSIVTSAPGIFSAHMGFIMRDQSGNVLFRHASSKKEFNQVVDEPFAKVIDDLKNHAARNGMVFMRVRPRDSVISDQ